MAAGELARRRRTTATPRCARCSSTTSPTASSAELLDGRALRGAGVVAWPDGVRRRPRSRALERALRGPRRRGPVIGAAAHPSALARAARRTRRTRPRRSSAWTACPVAWFVERGCAREPLAPDALPLVRGSAAHERCAARVRRAARAHRQRARRRRRACALALELLDERAGGARAGALAERAGRSRRAPAAARATCAATSSSSRPSPSTHEPREFELAFGLEDDPLPAAALAGGALELCGRDRPHRRRPAGGLGRWSTTTRAASAAPAARWAASGRLQPALYMLAVEQLLGVRGRSAGSTSRCAAPTCARAARCARTSTPAAPVVRQRPPRRPRS